MKVEVKRFVRTGIITNHLTMKFLRTRFKIEAVVSVVLKDIANNIFLFTFLQDVPIVGNEVFTGRDKIHVYL